MRGLILAGLVGQAVAQSPISRVVELIEGLKTEILKDGKTEQTAYDKFACWCEDTLAQKAAAIDKAKEDIQMLSKRILELEGSTNVLKVDIAQLAKDIAANLKSQEEATAQRQNEHDEYHKTRDDTEKATAALKKATDVLAGATGRSLAQQVQTLSVVAGVKRALAILPKDSAMSDDDIEFVNQFVSNPEGTLAKKPAAFLQQKNNPFGDYAPASTQLQGILKNMYDTFTDNLQSGNTEEGTKQRNFEELIATKQKELATLRETKINKETTLGEQLKDMADSRTQREETQEQLAADEEFFAATTESCKIKADEWASRTRLRTEELAGIEEAIETLKSGKAVFDESATTFVQYSSLSKDVKKTQAVNKIKSLAKSNHSLRLASLAVKVSQGHGHFDKVVGEIDAMIRTLREEETEDLEHKDRCEAEETLLGSRQDQFNRNKEDTQAEIDRLKTKEDNTNTEKDNKTTELKETNDQLAEALKMRNEQNEAYKKARKADAEALRLIASATQSLMRFYKSNGLGLAAKKILLRKRSAQDPPPSTWEKSYGGRKSENTGVVAILQMITEDIQNEMGQSKKDEATSVQEYQKARKALENTKTALEQAILTLEKTLSAISRATAKLNNHVAALDGKLGANADGEAAHATDCGWVKTNFESRRSKRQTERAGLEQAKSFLLGAIEENKLAEEGTSLAVN